MQKDAACLLMRSSLFPAEPDLYSKQGKRTPMSNPLDPTPDAAESAAHYRVSAQELSHIVSILQARKEAEARQRANTVALGDAVEQLGLEMSPEELLAEIQADRTRRAGGSRPNRQNQTQRRTFATFAVCAGLAGMMVSSIHMHRLNRAVWESRNNPLYLPYEAVETATPAPYQTAIESQPSTAETPATEANAAAEVTPSAPSPYLPLDQFEENKIADCDFASLHALANGKSPSDVLVTALGPQEDKLWGIKKQNGEVMVYVFATRDDTLTAMNGHPAHVYASLHPGLTEQLLPLRLFKTAAFVDTPGQAGADLNGNAAEPEMRMHVRGRNAHLRGVFADEVTILHDR